ncbi:glycine/D-amino acid oxidase-like deaminating enzyme [Onishia taeanensis]|uniref:Glycine/D-amino acid oxidase-like deaminating enzyme n=1 Tax=Onishia taeanensis TaxID=284577 RepID=A0A328XJZ2_9GAMM|nr:FAD-binding oxidoreductase [Halomonas taeanensis]RAR59498.1 glycine/D-amino acid oxidase-like deaminating enzyme [Halomonas taeanensis]
MKEQCLWHATSPEPAPQFEALEGERMADVVVIGGGITGLSTALHLAESGVDVSLVEAGDIPSGGSGRNVGLVNAGLWIPPDDILKALGEKDGERANAILGGAPKEVFALIGRHGIECHATQTGTLHLAHNGKGEQDLARRAEQLARRGAPVELLEDEGCWQKVGTKQIRCALLDRRAGTINPAGYTRGLARAASAAGARLHTHSPAQGVTREGDDWRVATPRGSVRAPRVVVATNAYTEDDWNQVKEHFFPGHFFQVASKPLSEEVAGDILPERQGAWDTRMVLSSMRRDSEGRLILGSLGKGSGRPQAYVRCWADRIQRHYFPQLGAVEWETTWTGKIAFTPDHTLRIFEPAPGILGVSGYNGRGVTTGTVVGKGFAHYLVTGKDDLLPLPISSPEPIKVKPLWSSGYEGGFTLYHAGQCLRVLI